MKQKKKKKNQNQKRNTQSTKKKATKNIKKKNSAKKKNVSNQLKTKKNTTVKKGKKVQKKMQKKTFFSTVLDIWKKTYEDVLHKIDVRKDQKKNSKEQQTNTFPSISISHKTRKRLLLLSILCLILALVLMFPFGITNYKSEASGKILDVPKFSKLSEECCMYSATFKSVRSYTALKAELNTIMAQYETLNCDGKKYFYNKEEDFTITDYGIKRGLFFNEFYITYGHGNSCEIDTTLKNIELLPDQYSIEDAKRDGCYIQLDDEIFNASSYEEFLEDVEQKNPATLRIAKLTQNQDLILIDLKYLTDGKFKVIYDGTRDRTNPENNQVIMAYKYEHIGIYKDKLYAYNGDNLSKEKIKTEDAYYLFSLQ